MYLNYNTVTSNKGNYVALPPHTKKVVEHKGTSLNHSNKVISLGRGAPLLSKSSTPVHKIFEEYAYLQPSNIAVISLEEEISYKDLNEWAERISEELRSNGVSPGQRMAIIIEPCIAMVASVLGVFKSGAAYVPLDHTQPLKRIESLLKNSEVAGILTSESLLEKFNKLNYPIYIPRKSSHESRLSPSSLSSNVQMHTTSMEDVAYMVYTSGSTGEPKGVLIGHQELYNSTYARLIVYPGKHVFLLVSPLSSDSSIAGIWGTLTSGGKLVVASYEESRNPEQLVELIKKHGVSQLLCIPSFYQAILNVIERSNISQTLSLNIVIVAGETLHQSLVERHFNLLGESVTFVNEYGPTETTVWATYRRFNSPGTVSIGVPIPGTYLYVLDENFQLVPRGEVGELFIGGSQVAKGYFGYPDATKKAFCVDQFVKGKKNLLYKTGDLVRWNTEGTLEFIGRKDHQVKIRGYRVELGAIEASLCSFPEVRNAVVIADNTNTSLIAFVQVSSECSSTSLRQKLTHELPSFMIPSKIHVLPHFPLTSSGKVDRSALSNMCAADKVKDSSINQPKDEEFSNDNAQVAARIAAVWCELLSLESVPYDINFFDLGGHSLMVFKLQEAIKHHIGRSLSVVTLFRNTTISSQAKLILDEPDF